MPRFIAGIVLGIISAYTYFVFSAEPPKPPVAPPGYKEVMIAFAEFNAITRKGIEIQKNINDMNSISAADLDQLDIKKHIEVTDALYAELKKNDIDRIAARALLADAVDTAFGKRDGDNLPFGVGTSIYLQ